MWSHNLILINDGANVSHRTLASWFCEASKCECRMLSWDGFKPERLREVSADLIVPIASRSECGAQGLFDWLRVHPIAIPVFAVFGKGVSEATVQRALDVADDFLFWPAPRDELSARVSRILGDSMESDLARATLMKEHCAQQLVGRDPAFVRIVESLPRLAGVDLPVLITGETGTGKELFARAIHHLSDRHSFPFIPVDCPSLPEQLFENEFFGHVRGAYTDAGRDQRGLVALAESGTLFLDEVEALPLGTQAKLLRFLNEKVYRRLGEERFLRADVRIVAASNSNLDDLVLDRRFRSDLFYRLSVLRVHLPPLRMRRDDIPLLANYCLQHHCPQADKQGVSISGPGIRKLSTYAWPGNVRELFSVVQRAHVACDSNKILPHHFCFTTGGVDETTSGTQTEADFAEAKTRAIEAFETRYIERMLRLHHGNITHAACAAKKERRAFGKLVKKYGINPHSLAGKE